MAGIHKLVDLKIEATVIKIKKLAALGKSKNALLGDGGGLYVQISRAGTASFIYRYMRSGKAQTLGLGGYPATSLKKAREKAQVQRDLLADGADPMASKREDERKKILQNARHKTFEACALEYIEMRRPSWKGTKHAEQWKTTMSTYAFPTIGTRPIASIDLDDIKAILSPIWIKKHETATRVRGRIESILGWAAVHKWRTGDNPARWKDHLEHVFPDRIVGSDDNHLAAMPYVDIPEFFRELAKKEGMARWALEFTILTGVRSGECRLAVWDEFDLENGVWTIPAERMKAGREHKVPLVDRTINILAMVKPFSSEKYVFVGNRSSKSRDHAKPLSDMTLTSVLRRMGIKGSEATVHGFRSSFSTWAGECTEHDRDVVENALAHKLTDKVAAAYLRAVYWDKRRRLMRDWESFCLAPKGAI